MKSLLSCYPIVAFIGYGCAFPQAQATTTGGLHRILIPALRTDTNTMLAASPTRVEGVELYSQGSTLQALRSPTLIINHPSLVTDGATVYVINGGSSIPVTASGSGGYPYWAMTVSGSCFESVGC